MKIYFGASVSGKSLYLKDYHRIVGILQELGHTVVHGDLFETSVERVEHQSKEARVKVHEWLGKLKQESDMIVIEASFRSFGLGQEIAHAFRIGKPVLALYRDQRWPHFILSDAGDRLLVLEYTDDTLRQQIIDGISYLNPQETKRFTMNIPSSLVDYLDRVARETNINRSEYIRKLIVSDMQKTRNKKI